MRRSTGERRRSSRIPPTRRNPSYAPSRPTHRGPAAKNLDLILAEVRRSAWGRTSRITRLRQRSVQCSEHCLANAVPSVASLRNSRIPRDLCSLTQSDIGDCCRLAQQRCAKSRRPPIRNLDTGVAKVVAVAPQQESRTVERLRVRNGASVTKPRWSCDRPSCRPRRRYGGRQRGGLRSTICGQTCDISRFNSMNSR